MAHTFRSLAAAMKRRAAALDPEGARATTEATRLVWQVGKQNMLRDIYGVQEDTKQYRLAKPGEAHTKAGKLRKGFAVKTHFGQQRLVKVFSKSNLRGGQAKGQKKWQRTGALGSAETTRVESPFVGIVTNTMGYAHARHNLALAPGDPLVIPPAPKIIRRSRRKAPWRRMAYAATHEARVELYRKAVLRAVSR